MSSTENKFFWVNEMKTLSSLLLFLSLCITSWAQNSDQAFWKGVVQNAAGAPVSGVKVLLRGKDASAEATTSPDGRFQISNLHAGQYRLSVESNGKNAGYAQPLDLAVGSAAVVITVSDRGEVTVAAQKSGEQAASGGEALSSQAVSGLPLNKRDFSTLLLLAAGTMTDSNGTNNFTAQFAINGQRGVEATFAMDDADISDPEMGGATFSNFNVDAVEGIDSSSGVMPAEIGRGAAGFSNIHTRSGASGFHGSFFEFLRNSALDARNYFDHPTPAYPGRIPPFRRNEFGFTNGGPVYIPRIYDGRKKTYYFTQYQGFRQVLGTTQVMPVPAEIQRPQPGSNYVNHLITFPDGSIDSLALPVDPSIAAILARYPLPNLPTGSFGINTYATASKVDTNADQFSIRIDQNFTPKDKFFARFSYNNLTGPTTNPDQTAIDPQFGVEYFDHQRNVVGTYTRTISPNLVLESMINITRTTPGFPTTDYSDPGVKFNDGLFEAFNSTAGSVMQSYANLFQGYQSVAYSFGSHSLRAGFEARINRDTSYFGISPNGEYDFGGGTAYATTNISSASGNHDIHIGDPLPDTFSSFITGSPFVYTVALPPTFSSGGQHIGPAAVNRENYNAWIQDTWKVTPTLTLDYGVRWEIYTPISERAHRTGRFRSVDGQTQYLVNPQPGYKTDWNGWGPRVQAAWQATQKITVHLGGAMTVIPPNIWQDNMLTGSTPYVIYPRRVSSSAAPFGYGYQITSSQLPNVYTPDGTNIFATPNPKAVPSNTVMDVDRYQRDLAALTDSGAITPLNLSGINPHFGNGRLFTWTLGLERKFGNLTADAGYVGTAAQHLPRYSFPNAYPGATAEFAKDTRFDSAGNVIGGFGVENVMTNDSHSTYHALQTSLSGTVGNGGPGIQAGYTWSKSIDTTSIVLGGTGSTGAVVSGFSQNPLDTHKEKAVSNFDVTHAFSLSAAQDLHLSSIKYIDAAPRVITNGWEMLVMSSISTGAPFTVYSGIQQTGAGSNGVDRPDQTAKPQLSTARKDRADYFGHGGGNGPDFFSIPVFQPGGTGPNQGYFGTLGRNSFRGPAFYDYDFAFIKDTPFGRRADGGERMALQFRAEFFNLFNIVNMGLPTNTLGVITHTDASGSTASISRTNGFGQISKTAGNSRQIQFSLKLIY